MTDSIRLDGIGHRTLQALHVGDRQRRLRLLHRRRHIADDLPVHVRGLDLEHDLSLPISEFESVLRRAGFTELTIQPTEVVFEVESPDVHWQIVSDMSAPVEQAKATLSVADVQRLKRAMADAIEPYRVGHRIRLPNTALCISGRR